MTEKKTERRGLGRGLSALMADVNLGLDPKNIANRQSEVLVSIEHIQPNPNQPRRDFQPDALKELADSLRQKGVIQPLIVRAIPGGNRYEIVAGERRWRAAQIANIHELPVIIRDFDDAEVLEIAIIENIQRAELNAIEEALGYKQLMDRFGHTQERISEALSRSRSHIANLLRLLSLPEDVQTLVMTQKLTAGHARALITTPNPSELAQIVVNKGLSVREAEALARKASEERHKSPRRTRTGSEKDADTRALESDLSANLKMLVRIDHGGNGDGGKLTVTYRSLDDLDLLCRALSLAPRDLAD